MAGKSRRFTISISPSIEADLDEVKTRYYYKCTRNDMLKDLIIRGLKTQKGETDSSVKNAGDLPKNAFFIRKKKLIRDNQNQEGKNEI